VSAASRKRRRLIAKAPMARHPMSMPHVPTAAPAMKKGALATLRDLWPYMWPASRPDLRRRVLIALGVLSGA
jgi:ATP-binding cassette subfamily B protein